jgi:membrane protein implicated in regulation of membrane protease activity
MGFVGSLHCIDHVARLPMELSPPTLWWLAAGVLVAAELATGTFYLLMFALGSVAGAVAAHLGAGSSGQVIAAALVGGGATALWHLRRFRAPRSAPAESNADVNLDIGGTVHVDTWNRDGSARVSYRGALWSVQYAGSGTPAPGEFTIVAVRGNKLSVAPRP